MTRRARRPKAASGPFHVVLLAGGSGTRFWPLSRAKRPKQFLRLVGDRSLLRSTWDRARRLAPASRIWVVAPKDLAASVRRELPLLAAGRLVVEPSPKDTAPAIALACHAVARVAPDAIVGIFPTDHVIGDRRKFAAAVASARRAAEGGSLVCLGITPDRPATGFGYLLTAKRPVGTTAVPVRRFVEKPDTARARRFVASGRYLWNGGMFVWRVSRFLDEIARVAPDVARVGDPAARGFAGRWSELRKISVDYAVMERAADVSVVPLDAGWDDVGSWDAVARLSAGGTAPGGVVAVDSPGSVVFGGRRLVALVGLPDAVVVETPDVLLVAARSSGEAMRRVVKAVREAGREDLL